MIYNGVKSKEIRLKMIELLKDDDSLDPIHDVLAEIFNNFNDIDDNSKNEIYIKLLIMAPDNIMGEAYIYGFSDTGVRDDLYTFVLQNSEEISKILNID